MSITTTDWITHSIADFDNPSKLPNFTQVIKGGNTPGGLIRSITVFTDSKQVDEVRQLEIGYVSKLSDGQLEERTLKPKIKDLSTILNLTFTLKNASLCGEGIPSEIALSMLPLFPNVYIPYLEELINSDERKLDEKFPRFRPKLASHDNLGLQNFPARSLVRLTIARDLLAVLKKLPSESRTIGPLIEELRISPIEKSIRVTLDPWRGNQGDEKLKATARLVFKYCERINCERIISAQGTAAACSPSGTGKSNGDRKDEVESSRIAEENIHGVVVAEENGSSAGAPILTMAQLASSNAPAMRETTTLDSTAVRKEVTLDVRK